MNLFITVLQYLILALWIGAMFGFGALFAPVLFRQIPSRDQAGAIVAEVLARIDTLGLISSGVLLVTTVLQVIQGGGGLDLLRTAIAGGMLALVVVSAVTIRQRIQSIRQQMGKPVEQFDETDPLRVEYNRFHRLSTRLFGANMLLGVTLIVLSAMR